VFEMPGGFPRAMRVAEACKEVLSEALRRDIKDPRIGFVTITRVRVSHNLRHADAFYTVFGDESVRKSTSAGLRRATPHLRAALAHELKLRFAPELSFAEDPEPDAEDRIERLLAGGRPAGSGALGQEGQGEGEIPGESTLGR
jgi:ribosome-binding factor A